MAMDNSTASSNDVTAEIPSASKEDFPSLNSDKELQGAHSPTHEIQEPKAAADPEGDFVDAETVSDDANSAQHGVVSTNLSDSKKESEDGEDEDVVEDENGSVESFDSALERIAVASSGDPASPGDPSSPLFQPAEAAQQMALRQLNLWKSGVASLDSALLENVSLGEFRTRVAAIAQSQGLSADSEDVENVISALLPLVEQMESKDAQGEADVEPKAATDIHAGDESKDAEDNVDESRQEAISSKAEPNLDTGEDSVEEGTQEVSSIHSETNGDIAVGDSVILEKDPVEALQSEEVADGALKDKKNTTWPESVLQHTSTEDAPKGNTPSEGARDIGTQVVNNDNEPEPEVIEWEELNESDDELGNSNVENPPAEAKEPKESASITVLQQESEPHDEPKNNAAVEGEEKGADSLSGDNPVDKIEEPKEVGMKGDEGLLAEGQEDVEVAVVDADDNEGFSNDAGIDFKADEVLPVEVVADKDVIATARELGVDDGKVEASEPGSTESLEQVHGGAVYDLKGLEASLEGPAADATDASKEGLLVSEEPAAVQTPDLGDTEALTQEKIINVSEKEELPSIENAVDASAEGGEPVKEANASTKEEDSEKEISSSVDTKTSTTTANDAASSLGGAGPSLPVRPAGLGRSVPSLEHAPRAVHRSGGTAASTRQASVANEENQSTTDVSEGNEDAREKLQMIRVKFLRLAHRLGQSAHNVVVAQVLYRLGLAEQLRGGRGSGRSGAFSFERASVLAEEQEAAGVDDLEFGCTIMVLGKSGVGKSATINSLFDEIKSGTNAYSPATNKVQEIVGTVHGIKLRVIDTPGLLTSFADQRRNERIMSSVKRFIKKSPPDIVLYFDRLDMQSRDYGDLPLLRTITDTFGSAVWFNAIVVLTHASSAPPDGANGVPVSYEMFVAQRSHVVQQTIRQAAGDMRLMNPVSLVENHAACRRNRAGERVLPNGQVWKPQLLLLCFASKILAEANSLLKLQDNSPAKPFGVRSRVPPLPFLLSSLLQSRAQLKLPDEQAGTDDDESEDESDEDVESEGEEEYDDLPPFRRLTREELKLLDKEQRKTYADELEYREKLFMKKQLKDERARKKEMKRRLAALPKEAVQYAEENLEEENASASVPVPMPDMALPPSFDSDNPTYRYRYLDAANQWLVRPVLETHGWDHDSGYDGLNVEKMFVVSKKIPVSISGQVTKDKKEANLQMECAASFKNGEGKVTQAGLDVQTIGKDLAYTLRSETRFDNFKRNKTTCGLAVTLLGDTVAAGMKIEDRMLIGKRVKLVFNGGALTGRGDVAYGGSLEATIRDKDYPIGQFLSTFGLSVMDWHGDLAIGGNLQVQFKVGKTMTIVRGNLNNRRAGQVSVRVSSSEQLQIALIGLIPLLRTFINNKILSSN